MPLISFSHPWYLLLLPLLVGGTVYLARHSLADLGTARARWSLGLRVVIILCALLGLAGLQVRYPTKRLAVLFVLDQSDSIPPDQKRRALEYINSAAQRMGSDDTAGVVVFGGDAYLEIEPSQRLNLKQVHSLPTRDFTNVGASIRLALAAFPSDAERRIVLLSDGNENMENALEESAAAAGYRVQVDVVPIAYDYQHEVMVDKMVLPAEAKIGEPFEARVIARSTANAAGVLRLLRNGELIAQQSVDLLPGPNVFTFHQSLDDARFHTYEAILTSPGDELPDNNRGLGFVVVKGKPRVLIVESDLRDARFLQSALEGQQLQVDVRLPGQLPATLAEFQTYDSVVLSNVGADQLTPDQMKAIRSSVRDLGAGLVMIGGENSFGPGAYRGTPIEEALPVDMDVRKQKIMPVGAVALVLHTCEFPDGNRWARETAAAVVDVLGERDKIGVLQYDMKGENWAVPLQPALNKAKIKSAIYNLDPGDMPDFQRIMKMAYDGLITDAREAAVRHIIVISDGDPSPPTPQLMSQIARAKVTVSTVAVFPHGGGTGTLEMMSRVGKGDFYNVKAPAEIPRIFIKEAQRVLKPAIIEEPFTPALLPGSQLLAEIDAVPPLLGYVATSPKEVPGVEVAMASPQDDPVLASWQYGLGKAVAFTSDAKNRWAAPWVSEAGTFAQFWAQTIRWTVRSTARSNLDAQVEIQGQRGRVVVDVLDDDGGFVNMLDIRGSVAAESSAPSLQVEQTAPGRYEGEFRADEKGQYMVALRYEDGEGVPRIHTVGAAIPYSPEYRTLNANSALLTTMAERTGGRVYPALTDTPHGEDLDNIWRRDRRSHSSPRDMWPLLTLFGALLLPMDVGIRRLMVSRAEWQNLLAAGLGILLRRKPGAEEQTARDEGMGSLLSAKARAGSRTAAKPSAGEKPASTPVDSPGTGEAFHFPPKMGGRLESTDTPTTEPPAQPEAPAAPAPEPPVAPEAEEDDATSRLLRAKRRARDRQE
jgi:uncharacterized membrane protein/secreted protein with Ig-like and vWFA domain